MSESVKKKTMFEPTQEPAKSIYNALVNEATKRKVRSVEEWIKAERKAVFDKAMELSNAHGFCVPTLEQIVIAENCACGHVDYAAKFAYGVAEAMRPCSW